MKSCKNVYNPMKQSSRQSKSLLCRFCNVLFPSNFWSESLTIIESWNCSCLGCLGDWIIQELFPSFSHYPQGATIKFSGRLYVRKICIYIYISYMRLRLLEQGYNMLQPNLSTLPASRSCGARCPTCRSHLLLSATRRRNINNPRNKAVLLSSCSESNGNVTM